MKPTLGRIVHYILNSQDVQKINIRRAVRFDGGTLVHPGRECAALITCVEDKGVPGEPREIKLRVFLDGFDDLWVAQVREDPGEGDRRAPALGTWHWPEREKP